MISIIMRKRLRFSTRKEIILPFQWDRQKTNDRTQAKRVFTQRSTKTKEQN